MAEYEKPKNPKRAAIVIVAIAAAIFAVIFIGLNIRNADDAGVIDADPTDGQTTTPN